MPRIARAARRAEVAGSGMAAAVKSRLRSVLPLARERVQVPPLRSLEKPPALMLNLEGSKPEMRRWRWAMV